MTRHLKSHDWFSPQTCLPQILGTPPFHTAFSPCTKIGKADSYYYQIHRKLVASPPQLQDVINLNLHLSEVASKWPHTIYPTQIRLKYLLGEYSCSEYILLETVTITPLIANVSFPPNMLKQRYLDFEAVHMTWIHFAHDYWIIFSDRSTSLLTLNDSCNFKSFALLYCISWQFCQCRHIVQRWFILQLFWKRFVRFFLKNNNCSIMNICISWQYVLIWIFKIV